MYDKIPCAVFDDNAEHYSIEAKQSGSNVFVEEGHVGVGVNINTLNLTSITLAYDGDEKNESEANANEDLDEENDEDSSYVPDFISFKTPGCDNKIFEAPSRPKSLNTKDEQS